MNFSTSIGRLARLRPLALLLTTALGCDGERESPPVAPPPQPTVLAVGTSAARTLKEGRSDRYSVAVTKDAKYVVSLTSLTDSALGLCVENDATGPCNGQTASPKDYTVLAAGSTIYATVIASGLVKLTADYVLTVVPAPAPSVPIVGTSGAIAARTPTVGWVAARSTSRYQTSGLSGAHTVSITGLTADAQLHLYADETYSMELDCTLRHPEARECVVQGPAAYFAVTAGPLNRDGAGYVVLVW